MTPSELNKLYRMQLNLVSTILADEYGLEFEGPGPVPSPLIAIEQYLTSLEATIDRRLVSAFKNQIVMLLFAQRTIFRKTGKHRLMDGEGH